MRDLVLEEEELQVVLLQEEVVHQQVAGRQEEAHEQQEVPREEVPREEVPQQEVPREEVPREEVPQQEVPQQEVPQQTKVTCSLCQALVSKKSIRAHERTQKCKAARPAPSPSLKRGPEDTPALPRATRRRLL